MPEIEIKFITGTDESTDDKLLPLGGLKEVRNLSIAKNYQLLPRDGFFTTIEEDGAVIPTPLRGTVNREEDGFSYSQEVNGSFVKLGEFSQMKATENKQKGSQFGVARSAKAVTGTDGKIYTLDIGENAALRIERHTPNGLGYEASWESRPIKSKTPLAAYSSITGLSDFRDFRIRTATRMENDNAAFLYVTAYRNTDDSIYGIALKCSLDYGNPGSSWDIVKVEMVDPFNNEASFSINWQEVTAYVALSTGNGFSYFCANTDGPISSSAPYVPTGVTSWWACPDGIDVTLDPPVVTTPVDFGLGRVEADGRGKIWHFSDAQPPRYVDTASVTTLVAPVGVNPTTGTPINDPDSKLLCDRDKDGVSRGIITPQGGLWNFDEVNNVLLWVESPYLGDAFCGNSILVSEQDTYVFPVARAGSVTTVKSQADDSQIVFQNVNRQVALYVVKLDGTTRLLAPVPGANVWAMPNQEDMYLNGNSAYIDALFEMYDYGVSITAHQYRLEQWEPKAESIREDEAFLLGSNDIVTDGLSLSTASFWAPPRVSGEILNLPTPTDSNTYFDSLGNGTRLTSAIALPLGEWRFYVVIEHTDLEGRVSRSAPAYSSVRMSGNAVGWELSGGAKNVRTHFGTTTTFDGVKVGVAITTPYSFEGTAIARVYAQDFGEITFTCDEPDNINDLSDIIVEPKIDTITAPFQEVASVVVSPGQESQVIFAPVFTEGRNVNYGGSGKEVANPFTVSTEALYGAPIYTTSEVPNTTAPQGSIIARTRDRFYRTDFEGSKHVWASKLVDDRERPAWSRLEAFKIAFPSEVMGMAGMDTMLIVLTRRGVFAVRGEGPSQNGQGAFNSPQELPGTVGCRDAESVLECPDGVFFLGDQGIHLVSRGLSAPQWVGQEVRDSVTSTCVCLDSTYTAFDDSCRWVMNDTADDSTFVVLYDRRIRQWFIHELTEVGTDYRLTTTAKGGEQPELLGLALSETAGTFFKQLPSTASGVEATFTTGELHPSGFAEPWQGRYLYLLGEKRSSDLGSSPSLTVAISYDGVDFSKYVKTYDLSDKPDGRIQLKLTLPVQKFDTISIKATWESAQGGTFVMNGAKLFWTPREAGPRLGNGYRG